MYLPKLFILFFITISFSQILCIEQIPQTNEFYSSNTQCVFVESTNEEVCASFKETTDCNVILTVTMGTITIYSKSLSIQDLSTEKSNLCAQAGGCQVCFQWEVSTNEFGEGNGCITLYGSCLSPLDQLPLGCFEEDDLRSCQLTCPNDCTGNGECQFTGVCDCKVGRFGDDCSAVCEDETVEIERLFTGESKIFKADGTNDFIGYLYVSNLIAEIDLTINPIISEGTLYPPMNVYSLKSCYPDPSSNFYDNHIEMRSPSSPNQMTITSDCNEMDGGGWFLLVQCHSSPCQFTLSISENFVESLVEGEKKDGEVKEGEEKYYQFDVTSGPFTMQINTPISSPLLLVELLPAECPSSFSFVKLSAPNYQIDQTAKYLLETSTPQIGPWYMKISILSSNSSSQSQSQSSSSSSSSSPSISFEVVYANQICEIKCDHGYCDRNAACECDESYSGSDCSLPNGPISDGLTAISTLSSHDDNNNDNNNNDNNNDDNNYWIYISSIVGGLFLLVAICSVVCLIFVCCVCYCRRRRAKNMPTDTLYNMLTQEQDLTLDSYY